MHQHKKSTDGWLHDRFPLKGHHDHLSCIGRLCTSVVQERVSGNSRHSSGGTAGQRRQTRMTSENMHPDFGKRTNATWFAWQRVIVPGTTFIFSAVHRTHHPSTAATSNPKPPAGRGHGAASTARSSATSAPLSRYCCSSCSSSARWPSGLARHSAISCPAFISCGGGGVGTGPLAMVFGCGKDQSWRREGLAWLMLLLGGGRSQSPPPPMERKHNQKPPPSSVHQTLGVGRASTYRHLVFRCGCWDFLGFVGI